MTSIYRCPDPECGYGHVDAENVLIHVEMYHEVGGRKESPSDLEFNKPGGYDEEKL